MISVDAKKRELVGDFKKVGRECELKGQPVEVRGHDFKDKELGHAIPYGVYDLAADEGWVIGRDRPDTAPVRGQLDLAGGSTSASPLPDAQRG